MSNDLPRIYTHGLKLTPEDIADIAGVPVPGPKDPRPHGCRCGDCWKNPACPVHGTQKPKTMQEWFDHFRAIEPTPSSRLLAACEKLAEMQQYIDDILTKDRLKTREINLLTSEVRRQEKLIKSLNQCPFRVEVVAGGESHRCKLPAGHDGLHELAPREMVVTQSGEQS